MSDKNLASQLKTLKLERAGGTPDAAWLASTRETILMQISNTVGGQSRKTGFAALAESLGFFSTEIGRMAAVPLAAITLMVGAHFGAAGVIAMAHDTLPGDALYGAKVAAEQFSLILSSRETRAKLELEISGRRLEEMARVAASTDPKKDDKLAEVSARFAASMGSLRSDLADLRTHDDAATYRVAVMVDAKADEYQKVFAESTLHGRPNVRLALLSLDQVSVGALEVLVNQRVASANDLPEAELSSSVGKKIETFSAHAAATPDVKVAAKAEAAVAQAKVFLSNGDFRAAALKLVEGTDLITGAQNAEGDATSTPATASASGTPSTSATATPSKP